MATYNKISRNVFPSSDPGRVGKFDVAYCYMDDRMRTIMVVVHEEEDTPERIQDVLREKIEAEKTAGPQTVEIE